MDLFEKINRSFGSWYEGLFGGSDDIRPKDVLRRILAALEDSRKEGFDNRVYVPNQYILEIAVNDEEEKEYLLSFLDRDELEAAIRRYCQQNHYHIRGALDFTIKEVEDPELATGKRGEKVRVRCRYNSKITAPEVAHPRGQSPRLKEQPVEERTVASIHASDGGSEEGTVPSVAAATLIVYAPDRPPHRFALARGAITIGRSPRSGNDLVIETDGQLSKRHARIEMDSDRRFTIYDLDSTNGVKVNGRRVTDRTLHDGDEILVGTTRLMFQQTPFEPESRNADLTGLTDLSRALSARAPGEFGGAAAAHPRYSPGSGKDSRPELPQQSARLILMEHGHAVDDFLLASETLVGRGVTNDIVLPDKSISTRHARLFHDGNSYLLESLESDASTRLNGVPVLIGVPQPLKSGDQIDLGILSLRFESDE